MRIFSMLHKIYTFCFLFALLSGCNDDDYVPIDVPINAFISLEDFEQQVINSAGTEAVGCGKVEINESSFAVNTCVSDSFFIVTPFYAFYIIQGIDSRVARAVSMSLSGVVEFWSYDSFGGGEISSIVCNDPSSTFELMGSHTDTFNCAE